MKFKFGVYPDTMIFAAVFFGFLFLLDDKKTILYYLTMLFAYIVNLVIYNHYNKGAKNG